MDKKQTAHFLMQIIGAYPNFDPTEERMEIWSRLMARIEYDLAAKRLDRYVSLNKFPPTIADILNPDGPNQEVKSNFVDEVDLREQRGW